MQGRCCCGLCVQLRCAGQVLPGKLPPPSPPASSGRCAGLCLLLGCRRSSLCLSKVLKARALPPHRVRPGVVRGCLCGQFLCRWGSKARAPSVSLRLWRWLPAGPTARAGLHRCCLLTAGHEGASPPQVPREREGVHGGEPAVAAARCGGDPVVLEALRPQGVWPLPWTLLLPSQQSGSVGGVPAKPPPCP